MNDKNRERMLRKRAATLGLRVTRHANGFALLDGEGAPVVVDTLDAVEEWIKQRYAPRASGPQPWVEPPPGWGQAIEDFVTTLAAAGQPATTRRLRQAQLGQMARELNAATDVGLADVTGEQLVNWLGSHTEWAMETRRNFRSAAKMFFLWAYRTNRIPVHIADDLPKVRQPKAFARPVPDDAWAQALAVADRRTRLIPRRAGECGMRRAEIAQVHHRDLIDGVDGAQLIVHGKGGTPRVIPLSDSIADTIRQHSAGGWLLPGRIDGHISVGHVGKLATRVLPKGWTLHCGRHRFASRAYRGSRNLRAVQTLLEHSSIAMTERYLACDDDEIRAATMSAL